MLSIRRLRPLYGNDRPDSRAVRSICRGRERPSGADGERHALVIMPAAVRSVAWAPGPFPRTLPARTPQRERDAMRIRAAVLNAVGAACPYADAGPLGIEELELEPPGPGEVLVRIRAAGLCHSDLSVINGDRPRPTPMALGHEAAGAVEALGPGVDDLQKGDHVVLVFVPSCGHCNPCAEGRPALCEAGPRSNTPRPPLPG